MLTITKKSATQMTLENLRSYIMNENIQIGERFPTEKELCATLGVGRGTVREAVKVLISQGLLEIKPGLGTFIKSKTPVPTNSLASWFASNEVELQDLTVVRSALEPLATKLAIEKCTNEQLKTLKHIQICAVRAAEECDASSLAQYDEEFHHTIFVIAGNILLIEINDIITQQLAQFRQNTFKIKKILIILYQRMTQLSALSKLMIRHLAKRKCASI